MMMMMILEKQKKRSKKNNNNNYIFFFFNLKIKNDGFKQEEKKKNMEINKFFVYSYHRDFHRVLSLFINKHDIDKKLIDKAFLYCCKKNYTKSLSAILMNDKYKFSKELTNLGIKLSNGNKEVKLLVYLEALIDSYYKTMIEKIGQSNLRYYDDEVYIFGEHITTNPHTELRDYMIGNNIYRKYISNKKIVRIKVFLNDGTTDSKVNFVNKIKNLKYSVFLPGSVKKILDFYKRIKNTNLLKYFAQLKKILIQNYYNNQTIVVTGDGMNLEEIQYDIKQQHIILTKFIECLHTMHRLGFAHNKISFESIVIQTDEQLNPIIDENHIKLRNFSNATSQTNLINLKNDVFDFGISIIEINHLRKLEARQKYIQDAYLKKTIKITIENILKNIKNDLDYSYQINEIIRKNEIPKMYEKILLACFNRKNTSNTILQMIKQIDFDREIKLENLEKEINLKKEQLKIFIEEIINKEQQKQKLQIKQYENINIYDDKIQKAYPKIFIQYSRNVKILEEEDNKTMEFIHKLIEERSTKRVFAEINLKKILYQKIKEKIGQQPQRIYITKDYKKRQ
jgi:hypothetical protein